VSCAAARVPEHDSGFRSGLRIYDFGMASDQDHFVWGVGTSAYQIEGAWDTDGKGPSIWDTMAHTLPLSDTGDVACDHYHRMDEDLDLLSDIGVNAYHFSTAWTRVLPSGVGELNAGGLAFYDRLVDGLLERGIEPWLTLYHWDLPQALQDRGGWANRESVTWFTEYASVMADHFHDRVNNWMTINEPWVVAFLGHLEGLFAPGISDWPTTLAASHHLLMAHGSATQAIKERSPDANVGLSLDCRPAEPTSTSSADIAATRHFDGFRNRWFFDPVFGKGYPKDMINAYLSEGRLDPDLIQPGDEDLISTSIDFCGINYYTSVRIAAGNEEKDEAEGPIGMNPPQDYTEMGWLVDPDALERFLLRVDDEWSPRSIIVTENGASYSTGPDNSGRVPDTERIEYLDAHIRATVRARERGAPIDGYFVWSFLDNLEWREGYSQRFGIVWVDHNTQQRILKDSAYWYRDRIVHDSSD
jgi:beta-glucosidase